MRRDRGYKMGRADCVLFARRDEHRQERKGLHRRERKGLLEGWAP